MSIDTYPPRGYLSTYEEGSFTVTATGFSGTAPSGTARYTKIGNVVTVRTPLLSGTSNATTLTLTGWPVALLPATTLLLSARITNNGAILTGILILGPSNQNANLIDGGVFTASGAKELSAGQFTYTLV